MLRLDKVTAEKTASGQVVNLMSNDVGRFDYLLQYIHFIWVTPIQMIIVAYIMSMYIGNVALAGMAVILSVSLPFQALITYYFGGALRAQIAKITDCRVQLMSELVSGIQVGNKKRDCLVS